MKEIYIEIEDGIVQSVYSEEKLTGRKEKYKKNI